MSSTPQNNRDHTSDSSSESDDDTKEHRQESQHGAASPPAPPVVPVSALCRRVDDSSASRALRMALLIVTDPTRIKSFALQLAHRHAFYPHTITYRIAYEWSSTIDNTLIDALHGVFHHWSFHPFYNPLLLEGLVFANTGSRTRLRCMVDIRGLPCVDGYPARAAKAKNLIERYTKEKREEILIGLPLERQVLSKRAQEYQAASVFAVDPDAKHWSDPPPSKQRSEEEDDELDNFLRSMTTTTTSNDDLDFDAAIVSILLQIARFNKWHQYLYQCFVHAFAQADVHLPLIMLREHCCKEADVKTAVSWLDSALYGSSTSGRPKFSRAKLLFERELPAALDADVAASLSIFTFAFSKDTIDAEIMAEQVINYNVTVQKRKEAHGQLVDHYNQHR